MRGECCALHRGKYVGEEVYMGWSDLMQIIRRSIRGALDSDRRIISQCAAQEMSLAFLAGSVQCSRALHLWSSNAQRDQELLAEAMVGCQPPDCRTCYKLAAYAGTFPTQLKRWLANWPYVQVPLAAECIPCLHLSTHVPQPLHSMDLLDVHRACQQVFCTTFMPCHRGACAGHTSSSGARPCTCAPATAGGRACSRG